SSTLFPYTTLFRSLHDIVRRVLDQPGGQIVPHERLDEIELQNRGDADGQLCAELAIQKSRRSKHHGKNPFDFLLAAPGEESDDRLALIEAISFAELLPSLGFGKYFEEGMAHKLYVDTFLAINVHFKRKDDQHAVDQPFHLSHPAAVPCPDLGADIIDDFQIVLPHGPCKPQVETRVVDEDN